MKSSTLFLVLIISFLSAAICSNTAAADSLDWKVLETRYVKIYYMNQADLQIFDSKIDYSDESQSFGFFGNRKKSGNFEEALSKKIDSLYERVQAILDMRKAIEKVSIKIYSNRDALWRAYEEIYKKRRELRAWYIYEYHTIYVNREDLDEGMLAHEVAHSVIDHFLEIRPPAATAEILARYVDKHLVDSGN